MPYTATPNTAPTAAPTGPAAAPIPAPVPTMPTAENPITVTAPYPSTAPVVAEPAALTAFVR